MKKYVMDYSSFLKENMNTRDFVKVWLVDTLSSWGGTFEDEYDDDEEFVGSGTDTINELIEKIENNSLSLEDCGEILFHLYQNYYDNISDPEDPEYNEELSDILMGYEQPNVESFEEYNSAITEIYNLVN